MRRLAPRAKRVLIITASTILLSIALVIVFISPIAKYLLEKNDVKWIGRELTMDWAYVNPFTGYVHLSNLKIFEEKSDSVFLSMKGISVDVSMLKLLTQNIEVTTLTIDWPVGQLVQRHKQLNISDIVRKFSSDRQEPSHPSWQVIFLSTIIVDGEFHYIEKIIPINYFIKKVTIESIRTKANGDTLAASFYFEEGKSTGTMKGNVAINIKNLDYKLSVSVHDFDLEIIRQYIWELINYGMLRQHELRPHQQKFIKQIAIFLRDHPAALLNVKPMVYDSKEKEYILFFETKKKYFLLNHPTAKMEFSEDDSLTVNEMSAKDPKLVAHISKNLSDTVMFTLQEKCINFVGREVVDKRLKKLLIERENSFRELFLENGTDNRVKILAHENSIPYNGFSYFKLEYPGEIPPALHKAYQKMNDLNDEMPRKKYRAQRKKETALVSNAEKF